MLPGHGPSKSAKLRCAVCQILAGNARHCQDSPRSVNRQVGASDHRDMKTIDAALRVLIVLVLLACLGLEPRRAIAALARALADLMAR